MKFTDISGKTALMALAAVCLLAAPALSMPCAENGCRSGHGAMFGMMNNLTPEEMDNMTLGELKEMDKQEYSQNKTCPQMREGQSCPGNEAVNGAPCQMMERGCQGGRMIAGQMNGMDGQQCGMMNGMQGAPGQMNGAGAGAGCEGPMMDGPGRMGSSLSLLMNDMTIADLGSMTLNEIKDLAQTKMQELNNMTLAQVKQLEATKMQIMENLTLAEIKEENRNTHQMDRILSLAGSLNDPAA